MLQNGMATRYIAKIKIRNIKCMVVFIQKHKNNFSLGLINAIIQQMLMRPVDVPLQKKLMIMYQGLKLKHG